MNQRVKYVPRSSSLTFLQITWKPYELQNILRCKILTKGHVFEHIKEYIAQIKIMSRRDICVWPPSSYFFNYRKKWKVKSWHFAYLGLPFLLKITPKAGKHVLLPFKLWHKTFHTIVALIYPSKILKCECGLYAFSQYFLFC